MCPLTFLAAVKNAQSAVMRERMISSMDIVRLTFNGVSFSFLLSRMKQQKWSIQKTEKKSREE